jgi:Transposase Tn5 dimerisation domain
MIASLGGFLARKSDGEPGPQTLWIGLDMVRHFVTALAAQADINKRGKR